MNPNPPSRQLLKLCAVGVATFLGARSLLAIEPNEWRETQSLEVPAPGLTRVNLPSATLDVAQPDLEDLRVLDPTGNQVPYLIERPAPEAESTVRAKEFRSTMETGATRVIIKTGTAAPVNGVVLETPSRQFVKAVDVEASRDGLSWKKVAAGEPIFQLPNDAAKSRVSFPEGSWEFLRLTVDDRRSEPVPFTGAELCKARAMAPVESIPLKIKSHEESLGTTRLDVDLGAANQTLASLRLETNEPLFTRSVTLATPELGEDGIRERTVAEAVIYRVNVNGKSEAHLDIPLELQVRSRELLVLIHNEDSPPLSINAVRVDRRLARLIFFANQAGRYSLLSGNSQVTAPRYDLSALGEQLKSANAKEIAPSALAANPNYKAPEALAAVTLSGAKIDIEKWKFRRSLPLTQSGVQEVELDPELLAHTLPDQRDVRLVREERQIPFLLERTSIARRINLNSAPANDPKKPSWSRWSMKLPQPGLPIARLVCISPSPLFHREMRLWEEVTDERGDKYPCELGRVVWSQTPSSKRDLIVDLTARPQSDTFFLETDNGDNPPIELRDFRAYYSVARVLFKATPDSSKPVWIYYGNRDAIAPHYDLNLVSSELLRAERTPITASAEENVSGRVNRVGETLTGTSRYIFWGALTLVVIALLAIMSRFLPRTDQ